MPERIYLIFMVVLAFISVNTLKLRRAVIYLGIFSLVSSFVYLLYGASDVAIAQAVIGSGISTVLYLIALKKYKIFTIYYTNADYNEINDGYIVKGRAKILRETEAFFTNIEMEPQIIYTTENYKSILTTKNYDLTIYQKGNQINLYGSSKDYKVDALEKHLMENSFGFMDFMFIRCELGEDIDA